MKLLRTAIKLLDALTQQEIAVVCAWCNKLMSGTPNADESNVSHTICEECLEKHYPEEKEVANA